MSADPGELLARTTLVVRRGPYALASWTLPHLSAVYADMLRSRQSPSFVIVDDREATAFLEEKVLAEFPPPESVEYGWCLVTLDTVMAWDVVGVLAAVTTALAEAGIPVGAVTAFSRDHILLKNDRLDAALRSLAGLCGEVRVVD